MAITTTTRLLAGSAAALGLPAFARAQGGGQTSPNCDLAPTGSNGAAITAFEEKGSVCQAIFPTQ